MEHHHRDDILITFALVWVEASHRCHPLAGKGTSQRHELPEAEMTGAATESVCLTNFLLIIYSPHRVSVTMYYLKNISKL